MNASRRFFPLLVLTTALAGCGDKSIHLHADLDLYLHPQASGPAEVILQGAISWRLREQGLTAVHVRVIDGLIVLSGTVESMQEKNTAARIAGETTVVIAETTLPSEPWSVRNDLEVQP